MKAALFSTPESPDGCAIQDCACGVPHVRQVVEVRRGSGPDAPVVRTCTVTGTLSRCSVPRPPGGGELTVRVWTDKLFGAGEWTAPVRVR